MSQEWNGYYYPADDAQQQRAIIRILSDGLHLTLAAGVDMNWPYSEIHKAGEFGAGDPIRLARGPDTLVVPDPRFLEAVGQYAAHLAPLPAESFAFRLAVLAAVSLAVVAGGMYFGMPAIAGAIAQTIPVEWEERLGAAAFKSMVPESERCGEPAQRAAERIVERLHRAGKSPYRFRVAIVRNPEVNAFAMPGGYLAVHSGLLERTRRPEELAGVMAHEMEHVILRHSTKAIARELSFRALLTLALGDINSTVALASSLGSLHFQRQDEEDADRAGMERMMAANIDPDGMVDAFRMLNDQGDQMPRIAKYLSTHPQIDDRLARLKRNADSYENRPEPLDLGDWPLIASACKP